MRKLLPISIILLVVALTACNMPRPTPTGSANTDAISTAAALTVEALGTQLSGGTLSAPVSAVTPTYQPPSGETTTIPPSQDPAASATAGGTTSPAPSDAPQATPTPTATEVPCDRGTFIDETIPDGTAMTPGMSFTKTWTIKNFGSCTWNSGYSLVFVSGDAMGAPASRQLTTGSVAPGGTIQVSLDLKAPGSEGTYRGNWKLRNAAGVVFGLGTTADKTFWVEIKVSGTASTFIDSYCLAQWTSDAGSLPCPGKTTDSNGFILKNDSPKLENGGVENEAALVMGPQNGSNGWISGRFPAVNIASGKHFRAIIGCMYDAPNCDVHFTLKYIADGGSVQTLGEWNEKYDGSFTQVDVDLSSLSGKSVQIILTVSANGTSDGDQAFWLAPRIN